ncbi:hypothetical protein QE197_09630 [Arsenophonus nasoniae]|uniref:Phage transcriptional regulator n=1 Tax=Arsenophonus nasoniae TaxID=638 RepID=A0A4P7KRG8_9GAMM|nr:hypothetical protein [Arsenophonus nasoniae]QBY42625.1 hypothetical protein ArsFIN_11830 [Arsenophonus nasoniae]QBY43490.1 hypothetical protein ArsFIN_20570 [Arsenophonus nasoniae]QBY44755.1 hypothetical protein ArsFIN_33410 [Arsenophonus nasoniae]WGM05046.1 hypothetical protein QE258_15925 [Arsenophonus nasoniae]WGM06716.1 hypothetical protein QE258_05255 [Arsenophonus nasoniae]
MSYKIKTIGKNVCLTHLNEQGHIEKITIPVADIPNRVNEGHWDDDPKLILKLIDEYWKKDDFNKADVITSVRCVISAIFVMQCNVKNGQPYYTHKNYHLPIFLATERMGMENNIEGAFYSRETKEDAEQYILTFYRNMLEVSNAKCLKLSFMGQEILAQLHNLFIDDVLNGNVQPVAVVH